MAEAVEGILEHYGVRGMHWGQRKADKPGPNTSTETVRTSTPPKKVKRPSLKEAQYRHKNQDTAVTVNAQPGKKVTTKGGSNREAHEDAVRAAVAKRIAQSSSTDALSTKELQEMVNRMNLEQQYSRLTASNEVDNIQKLKKGREKVEEIMKAKKTYDDLMKNDFVRENVNQVKKDVGLDKVSEKLQKMAVDQIVKQTTKKR